MDDVRGDFLGPPHGTTPAGKLISASNHWWIYFVAVYQERNL